MKVFRATAVTFVVILAILFGPYLCARFLHNFFPTKIHVLHDLNRDGRFGVETGPVLIGESRTPSNFVRDRLGREAAQLVNRVFFYPQGNLNVILTGRKVSL